MEERGPVQVDRAGLDHSVVALAHVWHADGGHVVILHLGEGTLTVTAKTAGTHDHRVGMYGQLAAVLLCGHDAGDLAVCFLDQVGEGSVEPDLCPHLVQLLVQSLKACPAVLIFMVAFVLIRIVLMGELGGLLLEVELHPHIVQPGHRIRGLFHDRSGQGAVR